jgi:hypothetical protein
LISAEADYLFISQRSENQIGSNILLIIECRGTAMLLVCYAAGEHSFASKEKRNEKDYSCNCGRRADFGDRVGGSASRADRTAGGRRYGCQPRHCHESVVASPRLVLLASLALPLIAGLPNSG